MAARFAQSARVQTTRCPLVSCSAVRKTSVAAKATSKDGVSQAIKSVALSAVAGQMFLAGQASAAQEVASMAGDDRTGLLLTLFLPVVGWVLFNIAGPTLNQLDSMDKKAVIGGVGLAGGLLAAAGSAEAAQEIAAVAGDDRTGLLLTLFLPVVGWVLFNIAGPALNQLDNMGDKKALIGGVGLGAALLAGGSAEAAQEVAMMAGDDRTGLLLTLFLPVVGWVLFNIAGPALNQLNNMGDKKALIGGAGLGAALLAGGSAEAAQEIAAVAGDDRTGLLLTLFLPVVGWVLFNIAGPTLNQLDSMGDK